MTDYNGIANALESVTDDIEGIAFHSDSNQPRPRSPGTRSTTQGPMIQIVEKDGVLMVEEGRSGMLQREAFVKIHYEREFALLGRSEIGGWIESVDQKLTPMRGLRELTDNGLVPLLEVPVQGRFLVLIHGTFSNSESFFEGFRQNAEGRNFLDWARSYYSHVLTFDHPTLSVSPLLNARTLAILFADTAADIDVICHSRGGLVTRWWLEVFDRAAHAKRRAVFVASPLAGTGLAAPSNIRGSLSLLSNVGNVLGGAAVGLPFLTVVAGLFRVVTSVTSLIAKTPAVDAAIGLVPGLAAQSRISNNRELLSLRESPALNTGRYYAVQSNFESKKPGWAFWKYFRGVGGRVKDTATDIVFDGHNDLVVDTGSMIDVAPDLRIPDDHILDFGTTDEVHHTNYFGQPRTLAFIQDALDS